MKLLIDADVLAYRAGFATEKTKWLARVPDGFGYEFDSAQEAKAAQAEKLPAATTLWSRKEHEPEEKALMLVDVMIGDIKARYADGAPTVHLFLGGVGNHRHAIATRASYKGNRASTPPPIHMRSIRSHLVSRHGAIVSAGEEADDMIAREALASPDSVVCTIDKDFNQVPCRIYNFATKEEIVYSQKEATLNFYSQVISGDSVDNIPGATGYGPVKSRKALAECKSPSDCWDVALDIYTKEFGPNVGPKYALECARLVKIGLPKGVLWEPPAQASTSRLSQSASGAKLRSALVVGNGKDLEKRSATA